MVGRGSGILPWSHTRLYIDSTLCSKINTKNFNNDNNNNIINFKVDSTLCGIT